MQLETVKVLEITFVSVKLLQLEVCDFSHATSVNSDVFSLNSSLVEIQFMTSTIGRYADLSRKNDSILEKCRNREIIM